MNLEGISSTPAHAIESRCTEYRTAVPCMVLNKITNTLPIKPANTSGWPIPDSITLADPLFHRPGKISVLLGIELFFQLLEPGKISLSSDDSFPTLQNTKLGWVVAGRYRYPTPQVTTTTCLLATTDDSLNQQLQRFWELEEYAPVSPHLSDEKKRCEDHFYKHTVRDDDGKFIVRLPFLDSPNLLGDSRQIAEKRLSHIERKLLRNPHLKLEYHAFLREYLESGHMTLIENPPNDAIYLPHHCVVKESSSTTKYRVVYDAAAKTTSGLSLNDILMQDSLVDILFRSRFPLIVFTGDIKQMYRMIKLADCVYLCIVWRWDSNEPVQAYRLNTVTYGTTSASYLATKCLQQLLESYRQQYPTAVGKAERGTYVDDVLLGADSEEEAVLLRQQVTKIFASGGVHLRKWASNSAAVLQDIELNDTRTIKALGIHWQPCSDVFQFSSSTHKIFQPTKRTMLSQIASIFDPLGLLAPIVIKAKMVMQQLWELMVDWDETPPGELVPRRVIGMRQASRVYLHGYSDASERAMGACLYIRATGDCGNTSSHLLCAKSKTAPIGNGRTTLPRLELCAAVTLSRLIANVMKANPIHFHEVRAFSDSTVALAWIHGGVSRWKTFVANRVAEITTILPAINWHHVDTHSNPADVISRGALPEQLINNSLWWHGPGWIESLNTDEVTLTCALDVTQQRQVEREQRSTAVAYLVVYENQFIDDMLARYYPNLQLLLRITARMLRFSHRKQRVSNRLMPQEIENAMEGELHCGPQSLLSAVRRRFWNVGGTSAARKTCRSCVECMRASPAQLHQLMGQIPVDRLALNPPFSITGIDYAGPVNIINRRTRGATSNKGYIALFACFCTRAVHLEAVSDLSTSAFIAAFTRFSSRYGLPSRIHSDNATNFRGAARKFRELYQRINETERNDQVTDFFSNKGIEWKFIPARSPHHGGLWEAGVKVAKSFLSEIGGDEGFTFEELSTVLAHVSACMNSRPIFPLSNDPNDPQPLTPAHFLIGRSLHSVPEINQLERHIGSLSRWEFVQRIAQQFRARWQKEYRMAKWQKAAPNISAGDFVLLVDDNEKPKQWPMGRIVGTFPGTDGHVRVVDVKTANGTTRRNVRRLRRIPLEDDEYVPGRNGAEIPRRNLVGGLWCDGI
ncbi:uncharacterized protein LOC129729050 [Wyeomyia smithii]|uniref:uncharacterized protein LOC129729050 n=1 Tax=Wyeomyia smithii TaxID=174621 RepID=UPI002467AE5E|nr:uncharacterized protein LOC129729050 [Wyeomyia smithii]